MVKAVLVEREVVHGDHGRVLELTLHAGLAEEARESIGLLEKLGANHLHGHLASDAAIHAEPHLSHAPFSQELPRLVPGLGRALVGVHLGETDRGKRKARAVSRGRGGRPGRFRLEEGPRRIARAFLAVGTHRRIVHRRNSP
jgi:hypothetical protein